tara:strand:- start:1550 stop:1858 length:309 start_codon:yes stop_codon:yes gene_type:complete
MARPDPTPEQLQAAWLAIRRPGWPETLADTLTDPVRCRLVHTVAWLQSRGHVIGTAARLVRRTPVTRPEPPPARAHHYPPPAPPAAPTVDRKRLASGDRDDD